MTYRKSGTGDQGLGTWKPHVEPANHDLSPATQVPGPLRVDPAPGKFTWGPGQSTWDPFRSIPTPMTVICHVKDYMERNNFDRRSTFWK